MGRLSAQTRSADIRNSPDEGSIGVQGRRQNGRERQTVATFHFRFPSRRGCRLEVEGAMTPPMATQQCKPNPSAVRVLEKGIATQSVELHESIADTVHRVGRKAGKVRL